MIGDDPAYRVKNRETFAANAADLLLGILPNAIPKERLPILDWCEAKLRYPTGRRRGQRYDRRHQPATSLFIKLFDNPRWRKGLLIGPNQGGKSFSLVSYVLNAIDNWREDIILGLPDLDKMFAAKWAKDFKPILDNSELRNLLTDKGQGSKGGTPSLIGFSNGRTLQAMGAGSGDSQRASSTSRIVAVTEFKDFGTTAKASDEGSKAQQLINRLRHYQDTGIFFAESTLTTEQNIAFQWYLAGTQTLVHFPCPHCGTAIAPEREDLVGWQDAKTEDEARYCGRFRCRLCGETMTEAERKAALQNAIALHRGQKFVDGEIVGETPPTATLSFRFSAATNMFADAGAIAAEEWACARMQDRVKKDQANRTLLQSVWAWPAKMESLQINPLDGLALMKRTAGRFGMAPAGTVFLSGGVDVRKSLLHSTVVAWSMNSGPRIIWWDSEPIREGLRWRDALIDAGKIIQRIFNAGFPTEDGERLPVGYTLVDGGWQTWDVEALAELDFSWQTCMGFGAGVLSSKSYRAPRKVGGACRLIGDGYHVAEVNERVLVELDASKHKSNLKELLLLDASDPAALTFAGCDEVKLKWIIDHLTAEVEVPKNEAGEAISEWKTIRNEQHLLDSTSYAVAARRVHDELQELIADQQPEEIEWEPDIVQGGVGTW